jgi:hypothetical protein
MKRLSRFAGKYALFGFLTVLVLISGCYKDSGKWCFAVMADTQWTVADDGKNPNLVAVGIINQLNKEFIGKGVKFVVAVGDSTNSLKDSDSPIALDTRATYTQELYNAGIGFYPLRGNHEPSASAAAEFTRGFPQTTDGVNNKTPADAFVTTADDAATNPVARKGNSFKAGKNFSSPSSALKGLSYSFEYNNARFVLLDQFTPADGSANTIDSQQTWIDSVLSGNVNNGPSFVFGHKGLITENHFDTLFGSNPTADPAGQDAFIKSLSQNGVRYYINGHDHLHDRSIITTTDGTSACIQQLICASDSSKFYAPMKPSIDEICSVPAFGHTRQTQLSQELYKIGYYIFTVEGSNVTVEYYASDVDLESGQDQLTKTPELRFTKRETFGYGSNGREFMVKQGASYTDISETFHNTTVKILSGTNGCTDSDANARPFSKSVNTGWQSEMDFTASDAVTLWGMTHNLGSENTDVYAISMNYNPEKADSYRLKNGTFGLATAESNTTAVNVVNKNSGGTKKFVYGPWKPEYPLGTYGVDPETHTAWAVINYNGRFFAANFK